ncbi:MAG: GAF domain-containing protein, partial [Planctomycetota bacterium]
MSTDTRNQNEAAEQVKQQVRNTIQELRALVRADLSFDEFCQTLLNKAVPLTGSHGAIIWRAGGEGGQLIMAAAHGPRVEEIQPQHPAHQSLLLDAASKQHSLVVPSEALGLFNGVVNAAGDRPGEMLLLVTPVFDRKKQCWGVLELLQRPDIMPAAQQGYLKFLGELAGLFPRWHEQNDLRQMSSAESNWVNRLNFAKEIHRSTELEPTAYAVANEARRLLHADRACIAIWDGSQCQIRAISSQDRFDNRANVVKRLRAVATAAVRSSTPLWLTGDTTALPPKVAALVNSYLDEAHSRTLAVLPMEEYQAASTSISVKRTRPQRKRKLGALVLEYFDREVPREAHEDELQLVLDEGSVALTNALETNEILFLPLLRWLGGIKRFLFADHLSKTLTALGALALLTAFMCLWPTPMRLKIDGVLQPEIRRNLFTALDVVVGQVNVEHKSNVRQGELLLELTHEQRRRKALELSGQIKTNR